MVNVQFPSFLKKGVGCRKVFIKKRICDEITSNFIHIMLENVKTVVVN